MWMMSMKKSAVSGSEKGSIIAWLIWLQKRLIVGCLFWNAWSASLTPSFSSQPDVWNKLFPRKQRLIHMPPSQINGKMIGYNGCFDRWMKLKGKAWYFYCQEQGGWAAASCILLWNGWWGVGDLPRTFKVLCPVPCAECGSLFPVTSGKRRALISVQSAPFLRSLFFFLIFFPRLAQWTRPR